MGQEDFGGEWVGESGLYVPPSQVSLSDQTPPKESSVVPDETQ